jgi:hypothetical protein
MSGHSRVARNRGTPDLITPAAVSLELLIVVILLIVLVKEIHEHLTGIIDTFQCDELIEVRIGSKELFPGWVEFN